MNAPAPSEIAIIPVGNEGALMQALAIREVVFIEEQSVPEDMERDEDDDSAYHLLAMDGGHAIGTGRLVTLKVPPVGEQGLWGRVGRMAVLGAYRQRGVGTQLLRALEARADGLGMVGVMLHAQLSAMDFYTKHGYAAHGAVFDEAGIPHLEMKKKLVSK